MRRNSNRAAMHIVFSSGPKIALGNKLIRGLTSFNTSTSSGGLPNWIDNRRTCGVWRIREPEYACS